MRTTVLLPLFAALLLMSDTLTVARAEVPDLNHELERLQGFPEHQKEKREFETERLSGLKDFKQLQKTEESGQAAAIQEYKVWKATKGKTPDENSPEYREDQSEKKQDNRAWEEDRRRYSQRREEFRREIQRKRPLPECAEYDVCRPPHDTQVSANEARVPQKDRLLYGNKPEYLNGKLNLTGGTNSSAGSPVNNQPPENDFVPPAPPPGNGPEFYEPAEPPPPPMPEGGFDDQVPPPVFDEP
jgi:hypothetical protein